MSADCAGKMDVIRAAGAGFQVKVCRGTDAALRVINCVYLKKTSCLHKGNENKNSTLLLEKSKDAKKCFYSSGGVEMANISHFYVPGLLSIQTI